MLILVALLLSILSMLQLIQPRNKKSRTKEELLRKKVVKILQQNQSTSKENIS